MQAPDSIDTATCAEAEAGVGGDRVRFVLVQPSHSGNIGAAARAIRTMGFGGLSVVDPRDPGYRASAEAVALATHALPVLQASSCHPTTGEALAPSTLAFAMTGTARKYGPPHLALREAAGQAAGWLREGRGPVAFLFGTERSGLLNEDVARCHYSCAIPADPSCASLNLAQAVQVTAYELRCALGAREAPRPAGASAGASVEAIERLFAALEQALTAVGFHDPRQPRHTMMRLRSLFSRAGLGPEEVALLQGICAAMIEPKRLRAGRKSRG